MNCFLLVIAFFIGLVVLFALGSFIGHMLGLDEYLNNDPRQNSEEQIEIM